MLFLITPLLVFPLTSELFEFNKIIFIYLTTTLILFFWVLKSLLLKKIILKKTPFDIIFFLFFFSQLLSTLFSIDQHTSIFGFYGRFNGGLLSLIAYLILYYGFTSNLKKSQIVEILKYSILSSILVFLIGLPGKVNHDLLCLIFTHEWTNGCWTEQFKPEERMFSTLGQPNWLGAYLSINFFISLYFYLKKHHSKFPLKSLINYLIVVLIFTGVLFSRSRSAIISTIFLSIFSLAILVIMSSFKKNNNKLRKFIELRRLAFFFITIILLVVVFKTGIKQIDHYFNFLNLNITNKTNINKVSPPQPQTPSKILVTESFDIRKIVWRGAVELGKRYPFFGTGVETFGYSYYFTRPKEHNLTSEWDYLYNRAHNEYLNFFATTGFLGLGTYMLMILTILIVTLKYLIDYFKDSNDNSFFLTFFLILGYTSILITNFFGFSTTTISLFFYLIPAMIVIVKRNETQENKEFTKISGKNLFFFSLFFVVFGYILLKIINYWLADINYAQAEKYSQLEYYQQAANHLNRALKLKYEHVYEDKLSTYYAVLAIIAANQNQKKLSENLIAASQFFNDKAMQSSSKNILYLKTKAKNNYSYYQASLNQKFIEEGIKALIKAHNYAPTEPKILYNLAIFYNFSEEINQNKKKRELLLNKALDYCNQAITLKPNYRDALFLKAQILLKIDKKLEAKNVLNQILEKIDPNDQEVKKMLKTLRD